LRWYQARDQEVAGLLGLKPLRHHRRGARYGIPVHLRDWAWVGQLLGRNRSVTLILEREAPALTRIKTRLPVYRFDPLRGSLCLANPSYPEPLGEGVQEEAYLPMGLQEIYSFEGLRYLG